MTIALVQSASNTAGASSTVTVTLGSPTAAGNCLVACVAGGAGGSGGQVTAVLLGGAADNWAALKTAGDLTAGAEAVSIWADPNCAAGQTAVAVTVTAGASVVLAQVFEFSGIITSAILDQFGTFDSAAGTSSTFSLSTGGPTTQASELAVGCAYGYNNTITGPSSPWVNTSTLTSTTRNLQAGYNILSSAGTVTYAGSFGGAALNGQVLVTLRGVGAPAAAAAAPAPPLILPHPLFTEALLEGAWSRADWQAQGVADLTVKFASTSGGVDTYNVTSPYNGTGSHPMRVLAPTAPNPGYPHGFLLMLPVEQDQNSGLYGDSIGVAQAIAAHNGWNLTCVQPGYQGLPGGSEGPWFADNPLNQAIWQEKFTLLVTAWVRQHLATTGTEQVYLTGFSRSGLGGQALLFRHPYTYAAVASWDTPYGMSDYDGTDPIRGTPVGGQSQDGYGTSVNFTTNYWLSPAHLAAWAGTGQYRINRIWLGNGAVNTPDFSWYDGQLTSAGIPHAAVFSNTVEAHAWQADWVAAGLQAIIPSSEPTTLPQQIPRPLFTQLLQVAAWRTPVAAPPPPSTVITGTGSAAGTSTATAAGTVIATGSATVAGAGSATATAVQAATGSAAGAGAASGNVAGVTAGTGTAAAAGAATAAATRTATASAAAAGAASAAGADIGPAPLFTVGFLTAATQRTGGPGG